MSRKPVRFDYSSAAFEAGAVTLIVIAAFLLRFIGLQFGFPLLVHPDEHFILDPVVQMTANKSLDPGAYFRPDLILMYLNVLVLNLVSFLSFGKSLAVTFTEHQLLYYYYGRLVTAALGAALPLAGFFVGREFRKTAGIPAALLFAFLPIYVVHSHYITPDVPVTLFTLLVMFCAVRFVKTGKVGWLDAAAVLSAVNTAEKYPGLLCLGLAAGAVLIQAYAAAGKMNRQGLYRIFRQFVRIGLVFVLALICVAPSLFVNYGQSFADLVAQGANTHLGADNLGFWGNLGYYAGVFYQQAGWVCVLFALVGLAACIYQKNWAALLALYGLLHWAAISVLWLHWDRWALPMFTAPLLLAALGFDVLRTRFRSIYARLAVVVLGAVVILPLLLVSAGKSISLTYVDTRLAGLMFCADHGITSANTTIDSYTPFSPALGGNFKMDYAAITSRDYIMVSSSLMDRYANEKQRYAREFGIYERIQNENTLVASFLPTPPDVSLAQRAAAIRDYLLRSLGQPTTPRYTGPRVYIYKVNAVTNGDTK